MEPYIRPISREANFPASRRGIVSARHHRGTLNLFASDNNKPDAVVCNSHPLRNHRDPNTESTKTREFPSSGIRHVKPVKHVETPRGIRPILNAAAAKQQVQVVSISAAYRDPTKMEPVHTGIRCSSRGAESQAMKDVYHYQDCNSVESTPKRLNEAHVGEARSGVKRIIEYTPQERFCQAVRDHAQHRARGVTGFYVQLTRNLVGGRTVSTPAPERRVWSLEQEPEKRVLTLARCHDQLVSLMSIPITLFQLAELLWDMNDYKDYLGCDTEEEMELALGDLPVTYKDFSAAFGDNSSNSRLAVMKI